MSEQLSPAQLERVLGALVAGALHQGVSPDEVRSAIRFAGKCMLQRNPELPSAAYTEAGLTFFQYLSAQLGAVRDVCARADMLEALDALPGMVDRHEQRRNGNGESV